MRNYYIFILILLFCFSCNEKSFYDKDIVEIYKFEYKEPFIYIYYGVPLETLYFNSGVDCFYNTDTTEIIIKFVRQKINNKPIAMYSSDLLRNLQDTNLINKFGKNGYLVKLPFYKQLKNDNELEKLLIIEN